MSSKAASPWLLRGTESGRTSHGGGFSTSMICTSSSQRSRGYGAALLSWLVDLAATAGCQQVHLDSGVQRTEAHRFYEREGMERASVHFRKVLTSRIDSGD
ncbi:MAG: GNAT family N-acetyltransferase [Nitrospirota bacterium]